MKDTSRSHEEAEIPAPESLPAETAEAEGPYRQSAESEPELTSEEDRPRNWIIAATIAGSIALVVAVVAGVNEIFHRVMSAEVSTKVLEPSSQELRELRAEEQAKLSRYRWVSRKEGVVRLPLDRALELTAAEYRARAAEAAKGTR